MSTDPETPRMHFNWTPEAEARLVQLIEKERFTASRVARILNREFPDRNPLTRNSVIGKINRLWKRNEREEN